MTSPYKKHLQEFVNLDSVVTIDRAGAPSVTGKVVEVADDACTVREPGNGETVREYFIAYDDMRGVSSLEHDLENA